MAEDKISYALSAFEKVEIVRAEIEELEEALKEAEAKVRGILFEVERLKFLASVSKPYTKSEAPEGYTDLADLEAKRAEIAEKLAALKAVQPKVEAEATGATAGASAPPPAGSKAARPGSQRRGFQSFDEFRRK